MFTFAKILQTLTSLLKATKPTSGKKKVPDAVKDIMTGENVSVCVIMFLHFFELVPRAFCLNIGCYLYGSFIIVSRTKILSCPQIQHFSDTRRHILFLTLCFRNTKQTNKQNKAVGVRCYTFFLATVALVMEVTKFLILRKF